MPGGGSLQQVSCSAWAQQHRDGQGQQTSEDLPQLVQQLDRDSMRQVGSEWAQIMKKGYDARCCSQGLGMHLGRTQGRGHKMRGPRLLQQACHFPPDIFKAPSFCPPAPAFILSGV